MCHDGRTAELATSSSSFSPRLFAEVNGKRKTFVKTSRSQPHNVHNVEVVQNSQEKILHQVTPYITLD